MAKQPKSSEEEQLDNPVLGDDVVIPSGKRTHDEFPIPEDEKLEGIDLKKINDIISAVDIQKGGHIRLERRGPMDQKFAYVARIKPEDFDIDQIMKLYGGGDYIGRTFRANGQMYKMFTFAIDARYRGALAEEQIKALGGENIKGQDATTRTLLEAALSKTSTQPDRMPDMMKSVMEMMMSKSDESMKMFMMMMQNNQQAQAAAQAAMMQMITVLFGAQQKTSSNGLESVLVEVLKEKATGDPMEKMLKMMTAAKELVDNKSPEREPEMWEKIVGAVAPAVAPMFMKQPPQAPQLPPKPVQPELPPHTQPQPQPEDMNNLAIQMFLNQVLNAAMRGSEPALYADMIYDQVSEEQLSQLRGKLTDAAWPANIFGTDGRVAQCRPWLEELKKLLLEDATEPSTIPGEPGNSPANG